ncbi:MAG TPA: MbcA/ParS/Xre antitoxin family protein [Acidobacteriaceae bacterium]|nr:MbcA/ParS/Xre antitoxin family protein [Acidobacteriaceae bacterium]
MATYNPSHISPGYKFEEVPDLSKYAVRERLSQSAMDGFFAILKHWNLTIEQGGELLGGLGKSTMHKLKTAAGTRTQDELTRISYVVGIYKALHILLPDALADQWMIRPNDNRLFAGHTPLSYALRMGIPGLQEIRRLLDASRGGQ